MSCMMLTFNEIYKRVAGDVPHNRPFGEHVVSSYYNSTQKSREPIKAQCFGAEFAQIVAGTCCDNGGEEVGRFIGQDLGAGKIFLVAFVPTNGNSVYSPNPKTISDDALFLHFGAFSRKLQLPPPHY